MAYELPPLPYPYDALEPHIDARTMEIHHTKHHAAYIAKANAALEKHPDLANQPVEQLLRNIATVPESVRQILVNNAGGHVNHMLFWKIMAPGKGGQPRGRLLDDLKARFGSFDKFKEEFTGAAVNRFGSGWAWLGLDGSGKLHVGSTANQDSPLMLGHRPILGLDVWEHAYYLKYQNRRPDYVAAWWNAVNWDMVHELYDAARS